MAKIEVQKLSGVAERVVGDEDICLITTSNGKFYGKQKVNPMIMLADVFFSKLAQMMGLNAAENNLAEIDTPQKLRRLVVSKNFLNDDQKILSFVTFFSLGIDPYKIYFSESEILQNMNLQKFFEYYLKDMPETFKESFIKEWLLRTYFRDADQHQANNVGVIYKYVKKPKEAVISPAHDFEYCMLSDPGTMHLDWFAAKNVVTMQKGLHPQNVDFLKSEYRDLSEKFLSSIEALRKNPEFDSLCEFSHLASFFNSIEKFSIQESQKRMVDKLTKVSGDVRQNCLKRGELLLSQWR